MTSTPSPEETESRQQRDAMADFMRTSVRELIIPAVAQCKGMEAVQDLMLGALAGVVECWVCSCNADATDARISEALKETIDDFVSQAREGLASVHQ